MSDPLITHTYPLAKIDEVFKKKRGGVIKVVIRSLDG